MPWDRNQSMRFWGGLNPDFCIRIQYVHANSRVITSIVSKVVSLVSSLHSLTAFSCQLFLVLFLFSSWTAIGQPYLFIILNHFTYLLTVQKCLPYTRPFFVMALCMHVLWCTIGHPVTSALQMSYYYYFILGVMVEKLTDSMIVIRIHSDSTDMRYNN